MNEQQIRARRLARERERRRRSRRARLIALGALLVVALAATAIALAATGGTSNKTAQTAASRTTSHGHAVRTGHKTQHASAAGTPHSTVTGTATGKPGTAKVPVLMYHVINPPPSGAPFPGLYVPSDEFAAQMQALKSAGWHAVTMDQLEAYWTRGVPLGPVGTVVR